jgi:hypothetical protein
MRLDPMEEVALVAEFKVSRFFATWVHPPLLIFGLILLVTDPFRPGYEFSQTLVQGGIVFFQWCLWIREIAAVARLRQALKEAHGETE